MMLPCAGIIIRLKTEKKGAVKPEDYILIFSQPLEIVVMLLFYPVKEGDDLATRAVLIDAERTIAVAVRDSVLRTP